MASSLTFSTQIGQNTVKAVIDSPDDAMVQATIVACARALGYPAEGKTPQEIMTAWMLWAWNKTASIARQQLEADKLATVRAEIDAQIGALE